MGLCPGPVPDASIRHNTDIEQIKQHYYVVHTDINPTGIVPEGPDVSGWRTPHGRG